MHKNNNEKVSTVARLFSTIGGGGINDKWWSVENYVNVVIFASDISECKN